MGTDADGLFLGLDCRRERDLRTLMQLLLQNLLLVFLVAGGVLHLFHRLQLPSVVGLLMGGVLIGPHGLGVLENREQIDRLAELGIMLLMFTIGLDFTRERLQELFYAAGMGVFQMLFCIVATAVASILFVDRWAEAVFLGFLVSHTSSTVMLKLFLDRGELSTPPVRLGLGISITQDLSSVLMLVAVPLMAAGRFDAGEIGAVVLRAGLVFGVALALSRWLIPAWLSLVIRSRSRELFLVFLMVVCMGTAWTTLIAGLSIGLGAFLAGIAIADSGYSHHTLSEVAPLRDLLISVFFVSTGMLLDVRVLIENAWLAVPILGFVLVVKFLSGFLPVLIWGYPLREATIVGTAMAQIGEFAFVVGHPGREAGLIRDDQYAVFLLVAVTSMIVNPFVAAGSSRLAVVLAKTPWLRKLAHGRLARRSDKHETLNDHIIIAGYGLNGRNLASALRALQLPFVVVDINPMSVQAARRRGEPVEFGDCSRAEILRKLNVESARGLVVAVSDPKATRAAIQVARLENPRLHIIVRTRYLSELEVLQELGADEIVAEEFETSLEVLSLALRLFGKSNAAIERIVETYRSDAYRPLRGGLRSSEQQQIMRALIPEFEFETHQLTENSAAVGKSLRELDLRARTGATLLGVRRDLALTAVPTPDFQFQANDELILAGSPRQVEDAVRVLDGNRT